MKNINLNIEGYFTFRTTPTKLKILSTLFAGPMSVLIIFYSLDVAFEYKVPLRWNFGELI